MLQWKRPNILNAFYLFLCVASGVHEWTHLSVSVSSSCLSHSLLSTSLRGHALGWWESVHLQHETRKSSKAPPRLKSSADLDHKPTWHGGEIEKKRKAEHTSLTSPRTEKKTKAAHWVRIIYWQRKLETLKILIVSRHQNESMNAKYLLLTTKGGVVKQLLIRLKDLLQKVQLRSGFLLHIG